MTNVAAMFDHIGWPGVHSVPGGHLLPGSTPLQNADSWAHPAPPTLPTSLRLHAVCFTVGVIDDSSSNIVAPETYYHTNDSSNATNAAATPRVCRGIADG